MDIKEEMKLHKWACDMADQKASGLSQKKWCEVKGIGTTTFEYRCRRVRTAMEARLQENNPENSANIAADKSVKTPSEPAPFFAKVNLTSPTAAPSGINIRFHDTMVNIAPDAPAEHVRMVLEVVANAQ